MRHFSESFLEICPRKGKLLPNAMVVLEEISTNYPLHIITNGFAPIQEIKLTESGLKPFFDVIVSPDLCGFKKPDPRIFHNALTQAKCLPENALYIGDSYQEDMIGGSVVGMEVIYFNPKMRENPAGFREIRDLLELLSIVKTRFAQLL